VDSGPSPSEPVDVQAALPSVPVSLSRVGLTGVEKVIRIGVDGRSPQLFSARIECVVDLGPQQRGAHMSRFEEEINDAMGELVFGAAGLRAERLAQGVAERVRERQDARRAEVTISARFPERRPAAVSGSPTQAIATLYGRAVASARGTRWMVGVSAQGMTTPGLGTLHVGCPEGCALAFDADELVTIVEREHRRAQSVEDCVRAMIAGVIAGFAELPDDAFVSAAQENRGVLHDVSAERAGLLGELRRELATGQPGARQTSMREWLET
jgi:GTP cyclohydrolase IV